MGEYELEPAALRAIFDQLIRPDLDALAHPDPAVAAVPGVRAVPVTVLVGAQPGAGKSRAIDLLRAQYPDAVEVIGDDLRQYHPAYADLLDTDPLRMPDATAAAAGAWVEMSIDYLRSERRSVLLETTMRQPDVVAGTLAAFRAQGYLTDVRVLAVPLEVSRLSTVARYVEQVREHGAGRWTPSAGHDVAAEQMPATLGRILDDGLVDRLAVANRAGQVLHERDLTLSTHPGQEAGKARLVLAHGRTLGTLSRDQAEQWLQQHVDVSAAVAASAVPGGGSQLADVERTLRQLQVDAAGVIDIAHRGDPAARTAALLRLQQLATRTVPYAGGPVAGGQPTIQLGEVIPHAEFAVRRRDPSAGHGTRRESPQRTDRDVPGGGAPGRGPRGGGRPGDESPGR